MTVLATSIVNKRGKPILSRQFRDLTKNRVTELLSNFTGLLAENHGQHTTLEDEHVRYVYKPLDDLYLVLITNRQSNILQDIETLNLFAEAFTYIAGSADEFNVLQDSFQILSAFDEIITLGYNENLSVLQIQTFLEMDSHEERIQEIIERNKELEATEERKRRAKEIQTREFEARHNRLNQYNPPIGQPERSQSYSQPTPTSYSAPAVNPAPAVKKAPKGRGLQLGKPSKKPSTADTAAEPLVSDYQPQPVRLAEKPQYHDVEPEIDDSKPVNNGILVTLEEKVTAEITREGSVVSGELKGVLQLRINDPELALSKILLSNEGSAEGIQFKTHPNVDRSLFANESVIGLKNPEKPFPSNDQNLGVLRWRGVGKADENKFVPIQFSTWLSQNGDVVDVTLEYELNSSYSEAISSIEILVPVPTENVELKSEGAQVLDITEEGVLFQLPSLSPGENGVLEFSIQANEDTLFPIEVSFQSENPVNTLGKIKVLDIVSVQTEESLQFDLLSELTTEGYFIV